MPESSTTTEPKRKRRWYQYSLRTFLLLVTAVCIWLGWLANQARQQRAAVAWVEEMGGTVTYDYQWDVDNGFIEDAEPPGPTWLRETLGVDFMADVIYVDMNDTQVSDVLPLAGLKKLQWLFLSSTQVCDVTALAGLKNLEWLPLDDTQVSDVTPLAGLSNLTYLDLMSTQVSDVTPLAGLNNLQWLYLTGTPVSEEQVTRLRQALPDCAIYWEPEE